MFTRTQPLPLFPFYLHPPSPFRRRRHRLTSQSKASEDTEHLEPSPYVASYLIAHTSHLQCAKCATDICPTSQIISKGFTGRHGRAFLVAPFHPLPTSHASKDLCLPNTKIDAPTLRQLVTGVHTVSDVRCAFCNSMLGWKYDEAEEESQRYKVGKYILEM